MNSPFLTQMPTKPGKWDVTREDPVTVAANVRTSRCPAWFEKTSSVTAGSAAPAKNALTDTRLGALAAQGT
jgi:hypothetical protein